MTLSYSLLLKLDAIPYVYIYTWCYITDEKVSPALTLTNRPTAISPPMKIPDKYADLNTFFSYDIVYFFFPQPLYFPFAQL